MKKVLITAAVAAMAMSAVSQSAVAQPNMEKYNKSCAVCHAQGVAGAPKTGDPQEWAPRMEKGMQALVASVKNGLNAMPPRGMCFDCSDEEYTTLIAYMASANE